MTHLLLAVSAIGVAAMLVALNYPGLAGYAGERVSQSEYAAMATAKLAYEPYVIEPRAASDHRLIQPNVFGYDEAIHHPGDDSVTLVYDDRQYPGRLPWPECRGPETATEQVYSRTYQVGQTFAHCCGESYRDHNTLWMYQYRGTNVLQGERSFVFVHFELKVPDDFPCEFPGYLEHTVDLYDADWFDEEYDLGGYEAPVTGTGGIYTMYTEPIKHAVVVTPVYVDSVPPGSIWDGSITREVRYNQDGTLTVVHQKREQVNPYPEWSGPEYVRVYEPGQVFLTGCQQSGNVTELYFMDYRGAHAGSDRLWLVNFGADTRVPIPCVLPEILDHSAGVFDTSGFDRQRPWFDGLRMSYDEWLEHVYGEA